MLVNTQCNLRSFTIELSIFTAHNALQLGEFDNHAGYQVAFAQQSGALQLFFINLGIDSHSQHINSLYQTFALIVHITQAFLEGNSFKFFQTVSQSLFSVFVEEEFSVAQTCTQYALVTVSNNFQMLLAAVADGNKLVQQGAVLCQNREVTLMLAHRGDDAFLRQSEEFFFEFAAQSSRPFYQIVYFLQQVFIDFGMTSFGNCQVSNLLTNQLTASVLVNHYIVVIHNLFIGISIRDFYSADGADSSGSYSVLSLALYGVEQSLGSIADGIMSFSVIQCGRTQEAVTAAEFAGFYAGDFNRDNFIAEQCNQPADRTDEFEFMICPTHVFREVQAGEDISQQARQQILNRLACQMLNSIYIFIANNELFYVNALATSKADSCFGRSAAYESDFCGRTFSLNSAVLLSLGNAAGNEGHTTGSAIGFNCFEGNTQLSHFLFCQIL